jgi:hypothetical protein
MKQSFLVIIPLLMVVIISNVYAGGPRLDSPEDSTNEGSVCWVNGYDSGFAGKYDKDRADECKNEEDDEYNYGWRYGCKDAAIFTVDECNTFRNNPVKIENYTTLAWAIASDCRKDGTEDGEAFRVVNEERSEGCGEYRPDYDQGYIEGCKKHSTESTCDLKLEGEQRYCPEHPDIVACVPFLQNATNKPTENPDSVCAGMGDPRPNIVCFQEQNPEKYCLNHNNTVFCRTIGDICDPGGFVRPEYPYCKGVTD